MEGVNLQLQDHFNIWFNAGLTKSQMKDFIRALQIIENAGIFTRKA